MGNTFHKYYLRTPATEGWVHYRPGRYNGYITLKMQDDFIAIVQSRPPNRGVTQSPDEAYTLYSAVRDTASLKGVLAEVGVNRGGSARVMCEAKGDCPLYLCDTFEGMPNEIVDRRIDAWPTEIRTHTNTGVDLVAEYLSAYPNLHFVKGVFPESVDAHPETGMADQRFRVVHLDVDLYASTLECLRWFWPRMVSGARIISHNYNLTGGRRGNTPGVKRAFMEFLRGQEHLIVEIAETQCLVIKP
jgi:O-methyltransferase